MIMISSIVISIVRNGIVIISMSSIHIVIRITNRSIEHNRCGMISDRIITSSITMRIRIIAGVDSILCIGIGSVSAGDI